MKELIESKWQEILNILVKEHEISEVAVNTWIQPLTIQTISDDSITFFYGTRTTWYRIYKA